MLLTVQSIMFCLCAPTAKFSDLKTSAGISSEKRIKTGECEHIDLRCGFIGGLSVMSYLLFAAQRLSCFFGAEGSDLKTQQSCPIKIKLCTSASVNTDVSTATV